MTTNAEWLILLNKKSVECKVHFSDKERITGKKLKCIYCGARF